MIKWLFSWFFKEEKRLEEILLVLEKLDAQQLALLHKLVHNGMLSSSDAIRLATVSNHQDAMAFVQEEIRAAYSQEIVEDSASAAHGSMKETVRP